LEEWEEYSRWRGLAVRADRQAKLHGRRWRGLVARAVLQGTDRHGLQATGVRKIFVVLLIALYQEVVFQAGDFPFFFNERPAKGLRCKIEQSSL
jgi:hypothetical protein